MRSTYYKFFYNSIAKYFKTPRYLILFVSDKCRMKCRHCWYNDEWQKENLTKDLLTFGELEKISLSIKSIPFLSLTGGEAFLREEIVEIADMFIKNSGVKRYDIPTSGWDTELICQKTEKMLKNNPHVPFRVDISIDGSAEIHDIVRNKQGAFEDAVRTIQELRKIKQKHSNFEISIITTVSKLNQNIIPEVYQVVKSVLPDGEWFINAARGKTRDCTQRDYSVSSYMQAVDYCKEYIDSQDYNSKKSNPYIKLLTAKNIVRSRTISQILQNQKLGGACSAGSLIGVIFNDGQVNPCETLSCTFGNIRDFDYDLAKIWNSANAKQIRDMIQDTKCICTHECYLSTSIPSQPIALIKVLIERMKL